jgi:hypothetical protein
METHWNINLNISNERQDCNIGTVGGILVGEEMVNAGEGEGIWWTDIIDLYEAEQ